MVPISGTSCRTGLFLILVVCTFTRVALGRGLATGEEVTENLQVSGGGNGVLGVEDEVVGPGRIAIEGAGDHKSTQRSDHTEVRLCVTHRVSISIRCHALLGNIVHESSLLISQNHHPASVFFVYLCVVVDLLEAAPLTELSRRLKAGSRRIFSTTFSRSERTISKILILD